MNGARKSAAAAARESRRMAASWSSCFWVERVIMDFRFAALRPRPRITRDNRDLLLGGRSRKEVGTLASHLLLFSKPPPDIFLLRPRSSVALGRSIGKSAAPKTQVGAHH